MCIQMTITSSEPVLTIQGGSTYHALLTLEAQVELPFEAGRILVQHGVTAACEQATYSTRQG